MMNIPYNTLIEIFDQAREEKPKNFITRKQREFQIKKIIHILKKSIDKKNQIYKKDIIAFFDFMQKLEGVLGNLKEFSKGSDFYLEKIDNVNFKLTYEYVSFREYTELLEEMYITLRTEDTVNMDKTYFSYIENTSSEIYPDRTRRCDLLYLNCDKNSAVTQDRIGYNFHKKMIETIIQYLQMLLL